MRDSKLKSFLRRGWRKFSHQSLFVKYFLIFNLIVFICFSVLGLTLGVFVTNYWTAQKAVLLKENAKSVATSTSEVLSSWLRNEPQGTVLFICNNLTNVSEAIDADVFMCDTSGKVILCKELLSSNLEVQQNGKCTLHEHYQVPQSVLDSALCGSYYERGKLDGMFEEEHIIAAEPVTVNGQVAGIIFAAEPTGGSFRGFVFNINP